MSLAGCSSGTADGCVSGFLAGGSVSGTADGGVFGTNDGGSVAGEKLSSILEKGKGNIEDKIGRGKLLTRGGKGNEYRKLKFLIRSGSGPMKGFFGKDDRGRISCRVSESGSAKT